MPTPTPDLGQYMAAVVRSKLLGEAEVRGVCEKLKSQAGTLPSQEAFSQALVQAGKLTEYQAALIQRGREDGFFIGDYVILERAGRG